MHLTPLLTDHSVLQRYQSIPVWGWTDTPATRIRATLNGTVAEGISGDDCRFLLRFPPISEGGPYTLIVETHDGAEHIEVQDILIGEVWLASGQSNMQWSMNDSRYSEEVQASNPRQIRMFNAARRADHAPQSTVAGKWELSTPETTGLFSAVATFFGNRLQDELDVPVGIIHSSWGGSFIETWISRERLLRNHGKQPWVEGYELFSFSEDCWNERAEPLFPADPGNCGLEKGWHLADMDDSNWQSMPAPGYWQEHGHNYSAVMWFRKRITLPDALVGQPLTLKLGGIDKQDITYVNGREVGRTGTGFDQSVHAERRKYAIPADLVETNELVIAVRAYSFVYAGGLAGPAEAMTITVNGQENGEGIPLAGDWRYQVEHDFGFVDTSLQSMGHGVHNSPYMLFENMIRPLLPVGIAGTIWYQGESNAGKPDEYKQLMIDLIEDWRYHFGVGDFPFIQVQLANYMAASEHEPDSLWARLREAQFEALELPHTGMAVIIDAGEALDIHPKDKKTVGNRLAQWALAKVYGKACVPGSPRYAGHKIEGRCVRIFFEDAGAGLSLRDGDRVETLMIAGASRAFRPASSRIDGASLLVWHDEVQAPVAVRYAWANNPDQANLVNSIGYPAGPFRTDRW